MQNQRTLVSLFLSFVFCSGLALAAPAAQATDAPPFDERLCQQLTKHRPSADVAYQPGVDVHGKSVEPADLEGAPALALPKSLKIPVTFALAKVLALDTTRFPFDKLGQTDINYGVLTLEGDTVLFNDQPLSDTQQDNLAVLCLKPNGTR